MRRAIIITAEYLLLFFGILCFLGFPEENDPHWWKLVLMSKTAAIVSFVICYRLDRAINPHRYGNDD